MTRNENLGLGVCVGIRLRLKLLYNENRKIVGVFVFRLPQTDKYTDAFILVQHTQRDERELVVVNTSGSHCHREIGQSPLLIDSIQSKNITYPAYPVDER